MSDYTMQLQTKTNNGANVTVIKYEHSDTYAIHLGNPEHQLEMPESEFRTLLIMMRTLLDKQQE